MLREIVLWLILLCAGLAAMVDHSFAAGEPLKLKIIYSSFTGAYTPLWLAVDDRLGKKYGLDFEAVYAGRARPHQLLLSGDAQYVVSTGTGVVSSYAAGTKDLVIIASFMSTTGSSIFSKQQIKTVKELQGKNIASGRPGAVTRYFAALHSQTKGRLGARTGCEDRARRRDRGDLTGVGARCGRRRHADDAVQVARAENGFSRAARF